MKKYGIRITLPDDDPLRAAHLLGENWVHYRWYASPAERDRAYHDMLQKHPYYRIGDRASQVLSRVEQ